MKLSLLIVQVVTQLKICRASILGPDRKFLVARNVSITAENLRNMGQYYYLWHVFIENIFINLEGI